MAFFSVNDEDCLGNSYRQYSEISCMNTSSNTSFGNFNCSENLNTTRKVIRFVYRNKFEPCTLY